MEKNEEIEIRSEKVNNIIGAIPPKFIRFGTTVLCLFIIILCLAVYYIPYPYTIETDGLIKDDNTLVFLLPYHYNYLLDNKKNITITYEGRPDASQSYPIGNTSSYQIVKKDNDTFIYINVMISEEDYSINKLQKGMKAHGTIVISNQTIWKQIWESRGIR